jgi:hypothetical protein
MIIKYASAATAAIIIIVMAIMMLGHRRMDSKYWMLHGVEQKL